MNRGTTVNLYSNPSLQKFNAAAKGDLAVCLNRSDVNTTIDPIDSLADIQILPTGKTESGYQFTQSAFRQLAQIIAPGLSKLIPDLAGEVKSGTERDTLTDAELALDFWNNVVDTRYPLLRNQMIIRNTVTQTIEGFVSQSYRYLPNHQLLQEIEYQVDCLDGDNPCRFFAAVLLGRRLSVWYRCMRPEFRVLYDNVSHPFYRGYYFTNGETTGTSVRGTPGIFSPFGVALAPYKRYGKRLPHTGRDIGSKMSAMIVDVLNAELVTDKLVDVMTVANTTSLGFVADMDKEQRRDRTKKLVHSLSMLGVLKDIAAEIVLYSLTVGRDGDPQREVTHDVSQLYSTRTVLDLYTSLLLFSRNMDLSRREKVEQAAFDIMLGRLVL